MSPSAVRREWRRAVAYRNALANEIAGLCIAGKTPPDEILVRWHTAAIRAERYFIVRNPKTETNPNQT